MPKQKNAGFTLVEVLIALAILSVALAAVGRVSVMSAKSSLLERQRLLANWAAQNHLDELRARRAWPSLGDREQRVELGGFHMILTESVEPTPNASFRRVALGVSTEENADYKLARLTGYLVDHRP